MAFVCMSVRVSKSTVNKYTQSTLKVQNELDEVLESAGVPRSRPDVELKEARRGVCICVCVGSDIVLHGAGDHAVTCRVVSVKGG